ncbi:hypothetical protein ACISK3_04105 [Morganella morganii]|nr:hypothetical protein [Morganella morganii]
MLRIDVIFSRNQKEIMPPGIFEALEKEIDRKFRTQYQDKEKCRNRVICFKQVKVRWLRHCSVIPPAAGKQ